MIFYHRENVTTHFASTRLFSVADFGITSKRAIRCKTRSLFSRIKNSQNIRFRPFSSEDDSAYRLSANAEMKKKQIVFFVTNLPYNFMKEGYTCISI